MARIRYLKPDFFFDDELAELKFEVRLFFQGLWCYADREGRLEDKPKVLKAQIMPYDKVNADQILFDLADKFITRYEIDGRKYIQINNFIKHQKPHHTEKDSVIPECNGEITVKQPLESGRNGKEEEKEKEKEKEKGLSPLQSLWNHYCDNLNKVVKTSKDRQLKERLRLSERPIDKWSEIFTMINNSRFCCGENNQNWKASYDWIIKNDQNYVKVLEGNYSNGTSSHINTPEEPNFMDEIQKELEKCENAE